MQQQQDVQVRGARGPCGEYGAIGVVELKQDAKQVFEFMRRVEEQPSWNPGVKLSQIVNRVANTIHVKQVLNWSFLALRGDFNMNLAMHEEPQQLRIRTELLQGSMMRRFSSSVGVTRTGPGACRLTMDLYMQPAVPVPFGIRAMVGHQVRRQLHGVMEKIKSTVENEQPRRRSFAERCCDMSLLQDALRSHPLDISVWG
ncbi:hypothetical protein OEZ85_011650 [Tetradesmus obliquus]|uniref:Coenzyme Q-binding protein COQ10 START domain-containing protein n=1 Tax=Tetradesmus obliquus TaxID=3088 RepID=A0ABY8TRD0_TETOB|nr:hypothetical protein OEZ85_011650 [Tetradesmus obliquus]